MGQSILPRLKHTRSSMHQIDRLGWAGGISFVSHGARIGIRVNDSTVLERLPSYLPPGWRPATSHVVDYLYSLRTGNSAPSGLKPFHVLYLGSERVARTPDLDEVFDLLESYLHFNVAIGARHQLFLHAGVVGWQGRAIVIPGRSLSGKTSLVAALVRAGATYYSDEYAVLDEQGHVHPYPKPLSIRVGRGESVSKCSAEQLGGRAGTGPLPVGLVVVTQYSPAAHWRPRRLSPGQALLALLDNTLLAQTRPQFTLGALERVASSACSLKGKRGEAEEMVGPLLDRLTKKSKEGFYVTGSKTR